jgi:cytochrome c biogenesis protein CcdA
MGDLILGAASALWLGILTSISPCPLATNVAAMSFIARRLESPTEAFLSGLLYTLGRTITYVGIAMIIVASLLSVPEISQLLQKQMNRILGPVLILVGMFLLELIRIDLPTSGFAGKVGDRLGGWGAWGGAALGIVFALSFCPLSAALFFASLIPLAAKWESTVLLPSLYGVGTALPVFLFALLVAFGVHAVGKAFDRLTQFSTWARRITGGLFIGIGIYFTLAYVWRVFP